MNTLQCRSATDSPRDKVHPLTVTLTSSVRAVSVVWNQKSGQFIRCQKVTLTKLSWLVYSSLIREIAEPRKISKIFHRTYKQEVSDSSVQSNLTFYLKICPQQGPILFSSSKRLHSSTERSPKNASGHNKKMSSVKAINLR